jgi:hypothetical protein
MMYRVRRVRSRMTHKIIFTTPFYRAYGAQPLCLLGCNLHLPAQLPTIPPPPSL